MEAEEEEDTILGRNMANLVAPSDRRLWRDNHDRVCARETRSWEFGIIGLHGSPARIETLAVPMALPNGQVGHLGVARDVTARRAAEDRLQADAATGLDQFAKGHLASRINAPLPLNISVQ